VRLHGTDGRENRPEKNEFLLLADVIGVSQLIETLNHDKPGQPVGFALTSGPFLRADELDAVNAVYLSQRIVSF
jgi:hypothetical protein